MVYDGWVTEWGGTENKYGREEEEGGAIAWVIIVMTGEQERQMDEVVTKIMWSQINNERHNIRKQILDFFLFERKIVLISMWIPGRHPCIIYVYTYVSGGE